MAAGRGAQSASDGFLRMEKYGFRLEWSGRPVEPRTGGCWRTEGKAQTV